MASLFDFVTEFSTDLANLAQNIENKMFSEPHASLIQARLYSEQIVKLVSKEEDLKSVYPLKHVERVYKLYRQNAIEEDLYVKLEWIRKRGNKAAHNMAEVDVADMLQIHKFLFEISVWYMQVYVTYTFEPPAYKVPVASESNLLKEKDMDELIKPYVDQKLDDMRTEFQRQLEEIRAEKERGQNVTTNGAKSGTEGIVQTDVQVTPNAAVKTMEISEEIHRIFTNNHFTLTNKTKKAAEFEHNGNKEVVYLLPNKQQITIVLNPETVQNHFENPDEPSHSTALRRFPKKIKNGKTPTNYGYQYKFDREDDLNEFLSKMSSL